jgi:carbonic anhydrase/acetyltransferase-like protein (isoleucine patch superfamily)
LAFYEFEGKVPKIGKDSFVHPEAVIIGEVEIGENCYIGATAVLRADSGKIKIGDGTNIQDGAIIHADPDTVAFIGKNNLVGHGAMLHGPLVMGEDVMVGINSTILMGCEIGDGCIIAAGIINNRNLRIPKKLRANIATTSLVFAHVCHFDISLPASCLIKRNFVGNYCVSQGGNL